MNPSPLSDPNWVRIFLGEDTLYQVPEPPPLTQELIESTQEKNSQEESIQEENIGEESSPARLLILLPELSLSEAAGVQLEKLMGFIADKQQWVERQQIRIETPAFWEGLGADKQQGLAFCLAFGALPLGLMLEKYKPTALQGTSWLYADALELLPDNPQKRKQLLDGLMLLMQA